MHWPRWRRCFTIRSSRQTLPCSSTRVTWRSGIERSCTKAATRTRMGSRVSRREFINAATAAALVAGARRGSTAERPNVLFILADDLGYGDLSCYGRPDYQTPVLDAFARQGLKFSSAYAAAPVCTPTRCAFVTGRYPQRLDVGLHEPLTGRDRDKGLPPDQPTIASLLKG